MEELRVTGAMTQPDPWIEWLSEILGGRADISQVTSDSFAKIVAGDKRN
jgi:hypothetical protein